MLADKTTVHLGEDIFSLTAVCYMKTTVEQFLLMNNKRSRMLYSSIWITFIQFFMIIAMYYAIVTNEGGKYGTHFVDSFPLFVVKFPCAIALHLVLYPQIEKGLRLMKFSNNNP